MKSYNNSELTKDMFKVKERKDEKILDTVEGENLSFIRDVFNRLKTNKVAMIALFLIILIILGAIFIPMFTDSDTQWIKVDAKYQYLPPKMPGLSWIPFIGQYFDGVVDGVDIYAQNGITENFWFGTDESGYDRFAMVWAGVRVSLIIALIAAIIDLVVGVTYGTISGYFGKTTDNIMQRVIEVISSIPTMVLAILLYVVFSNKGGGGIAPVVIALIITSWIGMSRVTRAQVMKTKTQEYVQASKTLGASHKRIMYKHLFPNIIGQLIVVMMFSIPSAIFFESFLSYIGLGVQFPNVSLGSIISNTRSELLINPYLMLYPALILSVLMLAFNLLANGLRDALDPKMRGR